MTPTLADQLVIARQAIEERRRKQEEEDQKDLEALERVARLLPGSSTTSRVNGAQVALETLFASKDQSAAEEVRDSDSDTPNIISKVLETVVTRPNASLSPRMVLEIMEAQKFSFTRDKDKRILSVAQALKKLTERDHPQVRLVQAGSGRRPNLYRALMQGTNPAHVTAAAKSSERTM